MKREVFYVLVFEFGKKIGHTDDIVSRMKVHKKELGWFLGKLDLEKSFVVETKYRVSLESDIKVAFKKMFFKNKNQILKYATNYYKKKYSDKTIKGITECSKDISITELLNEIKISFTSIRYKNTEVINLKKFIQKIAK